ncbi:Brp/Blh family beta-carotene 15,15'-dioxygenase [Salisaeta longa]|uniref:Brp/Blh family beta-carotene 15,15'-dioxygenase n=1 Tax=Salisaeta longa TaxID=503170 RepID=UPI0003B5A446|nr:Brp/Blh family beta-carotene 15,15'-dioxygenase [Salisaeta longa]
MSADESISLRATPVYAGVLACTLAVTLWALWQPFVLNGLTLALLGAALVLTGIPHGAVDHLVAARLFDTGGSWKGHVAFYGTYAALMAAYGAVWYVAPVAALALFFLLTMYHFGQADLAYWRAPRGLDVALYLSRGALLVGLPVAAHPALVDPIFAALAGLHPAQWALCTTYQTTTLVVLVAQHVVVLGFAAALNAPAGGWREGLNTAVLTALFVVVHPLVAFAVYFGLWHSLGHILELLRFFRTRQGPTTLRGFYQKAALYTLLSFVGLGVLYAVTQSFGLQHRMIALLFILISVLTLPHMLVVEGLYRTDPPPA